MIDRALLRRLLLIAAALFLVSAGISFAIWKSLDVPGGLFLGFLLGAAPFASWMWILSRGLSTRTGRALTVILLVAKIGIYGGLLYAFVTLNIVHPVGVLTGMTEVIGIMTVGMLLRNPVKAEETA